MNRHQRRRAAKLKVGDIVDGSVGRCLMNGETMPHCWLCHGPAPDWPWPGGPVKLGYGFARINGGQPMPLCEACFNEYPEVSNRIARKVMGDMQIHECGEASAEHILEVAAALAEKDGREVN
jgi:hypothetical protein